VREDSPWKTFADFIDHAKKHPGEIRVATPGIETVSNFDLEIIQAQTGAKFTHVPITKGPAIQLLGGHIEGVILPITEVNSYTSGGKFRILAASHRLAEFPKVPTILELGYRQDIIATWFGFFAPAGIPEEVRKVLVAAVEKAVKNPQVKARVEKLSFIVDYKNPAEMRKMVTEEYEIVNDIAGKIGLRK
jgi:tripartite-type tricarboxylate transporter receptor subunit TctC